jgi:DUF4097 and DUF4098 domain-containing protein YvlB
MESKNRNVWIVVIVVLLIACCCVLALAAGAVGWLTTRYADVEVEPFDLGALQRERVEQTFEAGASPSLEITSFAGSVTIRPGDQDMVSIVATKKASSRARLNDIKVDMTGANGRVVVKTRKLFTTGSGSVDLDITAPVGSRVSVDTGAGEVTVRDIVGPIEVHSGAGTVTVLGARGTTRVDIGAGQITYEGVPEGNCRFQTGAGEIILRLPADPNVRMDAGTGLGAVNVSFNVDGQVSPRSVVGVIGDGLQGSIYAHTGIGAVSVRRQ